MNLINKNMNYNEIFNTLKENGFKFGREYYENENYDDKKFEYYDTLPNHSCWIYYPNKGASIGFSPSQSVNEFVYAFNQFVDYIRRNIKEA